MTLPHQIPHIVVALAVTVALGACSDSSTMPEDTQAPRQPDPPGVAQALSIASESILEGMSDYDNAVKCAAALKITLNAADALASAGDADEMRSLRGIERAYRERAMAAATSAGETASKAISAIERQALLGSTAEHGQLALACLRSFSSAGT